MQNTQYENFTETQRLEYNRDYILAMKNNDLSTIKNLTSLGIPIAYDDGAMESSVYMFFHYQTHEEVTQRRELIYYIFEEGILNPKCAEGEKDIITLYTFTQLHVSLIDLFLDRFDFNNFTNYTILGDCIASLLGLQQEGRPQYWEKWKNKGYPRYLSNCEDLVAIYDNKEAEIFKTQILYHLDHLENFLNQRSFSKRFKQGCYSMSEDITANLMAQCLLEHINKLSQHNFDKVIDALTDKNTVATSIKNLIAYNRLTSTIPNAANNQKISKNKL